MKITFEGTLEEVKKEIGKLWPLRKEYDEHVEQRRLKQVRDHCDTFTGSKIDMIRYVRDVMDWSLYDVKGWVDAKYPNLKFLREG